MGVDLARIFEADRCRCVPADALVPGTRCGAEQVLDKRRHRCRLELAHQGEHVCWCERTLDERGDPAPSRGLRAIVASIGLRLAWIVLGLVRGVTGRRTIRLDRAPSLSFRPSWVDGLGQADIPTA
jgi:hypothetical protein